MNTKHKSCPEVIGYLRKIDTDGNEIPIGDKVVGIQVNQDKSTPAGIVQIDIREFTRNANLIIEIELPELVAAISCASLNAERNE